MQHTLATFDSRIARLELLNKVLILAVGVCLVLMVAGNMTQTKSLRAQSFQLISGDGTVHAELATRNGNPGLFIKDESGIDRVAVFHEPDGSGIHVMDSDGVTRIGIVQFSHGGGGVALHGPESKGAAVLYLKEEGSLRFFDTEGNITNQVTARE